MSADEIPSLSLAGASQSVPVISGIKRGMTPPRPRAASNVGEPSSAAGSKSNGMDKDFY